jgi:NAD(P)-dependent dehydrogenase (short-subunit alcohol dehydrogenase family)
VVLPIITPYAASKWALEAIAEGLALETGHFGVKVSIVQPGPVATDGAAGAKSFFADDDPYLPLFKQLGVLRSEPITPAEVAAAVADTIERADPPLRVPVGASAEQLLKARKVAPDDVPFLPATLDW